ncbi:hypothetical protein L915_17897, partial [Phytophthora nicotianae]
LQGAEDAACYDLLEYDFSSSDNDEVDDGDSNLKEQLEKEEDGTVAAHGRLWVPLDNVMEDSA